MGQGEVAPLSICGVWGAGERSGCCSPHPADAGCTEASPAAGTCAFSPGRGILQKVEDVAAAWGCERFLGGGKEQVLSSRAAWEMGPAGACCRLPLCPWSKRGYLGGAWEGKRPRCAQAAVQSGGLGWRQSYLTAYAAWSQGSRFGLQGVSDCAYPVWGSDQLNWKELFPGERPSGYHTRPRVKISRADESTLLCCAVYHPAQKCCPETNWDQQGQSSQHRWRRYCNSSVAAVMHQSGGMLQGAGPLCSQRMRGRCRCHQRCCSCCVCSVTKAGSTRGPVHKIQS